MSELALIEKVETLIRKDVTSDLKEIIAGRLMDFVKKECNGFGPDSFRTKELIQNIIKHVEEA